MYIRSEPDSLQKIALSGQANCLEEAGDPAIKLHPAAGKMIPVEVDGVRLEVAHVATPTGPKPVLKTMTTTACERDCYYCPFRAGRGAMRRVSFKPDELADSFDRIQRSGIVDGIFLSSGIIRGGVSTQDRIIDTIEIIRRKYAYQGYIHLKIMPGAEYDQLVRAMQLADRVSINLEAPTPARLRALAPTKDFETDLLTRLRWAHSIRQNAPPGAIRAGAVTQFVVGAVGDTDLELLSLSANLYRQSGLRRAYYSSFNPISETPFEHLPPASPRREFRLYQSSFLLRDYQWDVEDLPFEADGNLRLDVDPKRAWADLHLRHNPLDLMAAGYEQLLRVPGIGPKGAQSILRARKKGRLSDLSHLRSLGIHAPEKLAAYILLDGRRPPVQLSLWD